ncbi:MAG: amino acid ABC transporter ATP-binding protein [Bacteroidales bacterium]|nr:amino acid ABC transporter ATP-binding protein [Bacteroidales bacterium]
MIRVTDIVKAFDGHRILDGVSLEVKQGEVTALVGPSGGGKSTLLRCINGLETFTSGRITVGSITLMGGVPHAEPLLVELRRTIGMVFQQFHLFPHMTALENVMSGPRFALGLSRQECEPAARKLLDRVGLSHKYDAKPANLSGGQQQRVAIARSLAVKPTAILFDEPTSALDPKMAVEVLSVMRDLAHDGQTMIVVTHDMDLAREAHIVHVMEAGRIARSGPPAECLI